jgi:hypothetical protein
MLFSTGAGPNLLRLPNGAKCGSFVRHLTSGKMEKLCRPHTVVGPRNFTGSWSPHRAQQRMSGKQKVRREGEMGGDDCAEQGEVTNSATCRAKSHPRIRDSHVRPTFCHTLSCPASDTLKVKSTKNCQKNPADHLPLHRFTGTSLQTTETRKRFS